MSDRVRKYRGEDIVVNYDVKRCIHAEECVKGLPAAFDRDRRPWVDADAARADEVAEVVIRCPTGALWYERTDGGMAEPVPETNTAEVSRDGPIHLRGDVEIVSASGETLAEVKRVSLCRCGASGNMPFCDGSHSAVGFKHAGEVANPKPIPEEYEAGGRLTVTPRANGSLLLEGALEVRSADGGTSSYHDARVSLCRCGGSSNKPFCDGTHKHIGFSAE